MPGGEQRQPVAVQVVADRPLSDAACPHRVTAVQRGQRHQRGGAVRHRHHDGAVNGEGLAESGRRGRVRPVDAEHDALRQAAGRARRCGRGAGAGGFECGPRRCKVAGGDPHQGRGRAHRGVGVRTEPVEQLRGVRVVAVMGGDSGRDPHAGGAVGRVG